MIQSENFRFFCPISKDATRHKIKDEKIRKVEGASVKFLFGEKSKRNFFRNVLLNVVKGRNSELGIVCTTCICKQYINQFGYISQIIIYSWKGLGYLPI